jgi:hypothetical protein
MNEVIKGAWAQALSKDKFICVETYSGYGTGNRADPKGKQNLLAPDASDQVLGAAVLDALAHSRCLVLGAPRSDVQLPPEVEFDPELYDYQLSNERYGVWVRTLMESYGYKSRQSLFKGMKNCFIKRVGSAITFVPSKHQKLESWGRTKDDGIEDVVVSAESTPAEIGAALRLAFCRCTG